ncbi:TLC domain-containing protein [Drosera capensis]
MSISSMTVMTIKSYKNQAQGLVKDYLLADPFIPYTSVIAGILACKVIYDLTDRISSLHFKSYSGLTKAQRIEWNNRGMSTVHAVFIAAMSLDFVFWSDLFGDDRTTELVTFRSSALSTFALGVSVGYFITDLSMVLWLYPSLGGREYVLHHSLSCISVAYSMFSGEGQLYTFMVLISEVTTPEINMRCWVKEVERIYSEWDRDILRLAGYPNAPVWLLSGVCGAVRTGRHELDVVWEDYQGTEEDLDEEAMMKERSKFLLTLYVTGLFDLVLVKRWIVKGKLKYRILEFCRGSIGDPQMFTV